MTPPGSKRPPTHADDRDHQKPKTSPYGHPIVPPHEFGEDDPITGQYEGEALDQMRRKRPTLARIGHLEKKHDELHGTVLRMDGKLDGVHDFMARADAAREALAKREQARRDARGKWILAVITALGVAVAAIAAAVH